MWEGRLFPSQDQPFNEDIMADKKQLSDELMLTKALLFRRIPFLGALGQKCTYVFTEEVPTAAADASGKIYINPRFWDMLPNSDGMFTHHQWLLSHEILHVALQHVWRMKVHLVLMDKQPEDWTEGDKEKFRLGNVAADVIVAAYQKAVTSPNSNTTLFAPPPPDHFRQFGFSGEVRFIDEKYLEEEYGVTLPQSPLKMSVEEIFDLLLRELPESAQREVAGYLMEDMKTTGDDSGTSSVDAGDTQGNKKPVLIVGNNDGEVDWDKAVKQAFISQQIAEQQQHGAGQNPLGILRDVLFKKAPVRWEDLFQFTLQASLPDTEERSYRRINRRLPEYEGGILRKGWLKAEELPFVWLVVDTSGSMYDDVLSFVKDMIVSCQTELRVLYHDTAVYLEEDIQNPTLLGGGGTEFTPVFEAIESLKIQTPNGPVQIADRPPDLVVWLTDLDCWDSPPYHKFQNIIWLAIGDYRDDPPTGKTIRIRNLF